MVLALTASVDLNASLQDFWSHLSQPIPRLLLQIAIIILLSYLFGFILRKIRQPYVIGEILAGLFLGPSLLGYLVPSTSEWLFPASSLPPLQFLSQIGLILFMFIVGMELDGKKIQQRVFSAVVVSHTSIFLPFLLGIALAYRFYPTYASANHSLLPFMLFMGIAMSITAFPVLAKILQERGLTTTPLGNMAITCAAVDDVTAWCILAVVISVAKATAVTSLLFSFFLLALYLLTMWYLARPLLQWIYRDHTTEGNFTRATLTSTFIILLLSCCITEAIGVHALFGAFLTGVIMPHKPQVRRILKNKIEDISLFLLLPLFFVLTGLRTKINLLDSSALWLDTGLIVLLAVLGKFGGCALAARFTGNTWTDSLKLGVLMNTRGLMELVVLNIGYDLGLISQTLFTMMVIMALVTTIMTGPAIDLINFLFKTEDEKMTPDELTITS